MAHLVLALEEWAIKYEQTERYEFPGGTIVPKAQVIEVRGEGAVTRPSARCNVYMDVRLVPGKSPLMIKKQIDELVRAMDVDCDVSIFQYSRGYIAQNAEPLIAALEEAHRYVFGKEPSAPPSAEVSMWRDVNVFNEVGIPSVCYGPPRQKESMSGAQNRAMKISDLVNASKVYALTALSVCGGKQR
jgi:acetylornithine deacetylase/succinyl-diaminopimelate desuccinylase-like protein